MALAAALVARADRAVRTLEDDLGAVRRNGEAIMNFQQAIVSNFKRYVDFNGRSARSEYWWWALLLFGINCVVALLGVIVGGATSSMYPIVNALSTLVSLGLFLPGLAVAVRRLHDTNRSGWWVLIAFTIIGVIPLIIWFATRGTIGDNQHGPDPLSGGSPDTPTTQTTWAN
jgi:uncharacterized membrane protein YhaH (DUF805 family)